MASPDHKILALGSFALLLVSVMLWCYQTGSIAWAVLCSVVAAATFLGMAHLPEGPQRHTARTERPSRGRRA
jgi:peptidoglycan/LPS O-acetylase OafA/YrhL